jgi:hypothetical protein
MTQIVRDSKAPETVYRSFPNPSPGVSVINHRRIISLARLAQTVVDDQTSSRCEFPHFKVLSARKNFDAQ